MIPTPFGPTIIRICRIFCIFRNFPKDGWGGFSFWYLEPIYTTWNLPLPRKRRLAPGTMGGNSPETEDEKMLNMLKTRKICKMAQMLPISVGLTIFASFASFTYFASFATFQIDGGKRFHNLVSRATLHPTEPAPCIYSGHWLQTRWVAPHQETKS